MHLQSGLRSLSATVNNVLQFHGKSVPANFFLFDSIARFEHTAEFLGPLAAAQGHTIQLENSVGAVTVAADSHRLQQVFLNIALNGFRAMAQGGSSRFVSVGGPSSAGFVQIDFQDEGQRDRAAVCWRKFLSRVSRPKRAAQAGSVGLQESDRTTRRNDRSGKPAAAGQHVYDLFWRASEEVSE